MEYRNQCPSCNSTDIEIEEGVNGSDFIKCFSCKTGFNIIVSVLNEEGEVID